MKEEKNKLKEYKSKSVEPYYFTISSNKHYIYRYFKSCDRLQQFLENGIFMSSACSFSDGLECIDKETIKKVKHLHNYQELRPENNPDYTSDELAKIKDNSYKKLKDLSLNIEEEQKKYFISCWYLPDSEHENELMWKSYGTSEEFGYLVKIKLEYFLDHLISSSYLNEKLGTIIYGIVRYYDFNKSEKIQPLKYKAFRKHNSYSDERELRLVIKNESSFEREAFYIRMNKDFYNDIIIYLDPKASYEKYVEIRQQILLKHKKDLYQSELSVAYNLRNYSKS